MKTKKEIEALLLSVDKEIWNSEEEHNMCLSSKDSVMKIIEIDRKLSKLNGEREAYKKILGLKKYVVLEDGTILKR